MYNNSKYFYEKHEKSKFTTGDFSKKCQNGKNMSFSSGKGFKNSSKIPSGNLRLLLQKCEKSKFTPFWVGNLHKITK